jgi:hypothetical protein
MTCRYCGEFFREGQGVVGRYCSEGCQHFSRLGASQPAPQETCDRCFKPLPAGRHIYCEECSKIQVACADPTKFPVGGLRWMVTDTAKVVYYASPQRKTVVRELEGVYED